MAAILSNDRCQVRPPTEPVPEAQRGTPAGLIFGHMIRFNDGAGHCPFKGAVTMRTCQPVSVLILLPGETLRGFAPQMRATALSEAPTRLAKV